MEPRYSVVFVPIGMRTKNSYLFFVRTTIFGASCSPRSCYAWIWTLSGDDLTKGLMELIRTEGHKEDLYIRPLAFYSDEIIGVRVHDLTAEHSIVVMPFGAYNKNEDNMHVTVSSWRRIDDNTIPARGKIAGAYVNSAFIKTDAVRAGFDEAIVLNADGHVSEGSAANFFMLRNGVLRTPPITDNVLEGITRRTVIQLIRDEFEMEVQERQIDRTEALSGRRDVLLRNGRADQRDYPSRSSSSSERVKWASSPPPA